MELIFVGTGVSTGIPVMGHFLGGCACDDAINTPNSKNRRNNVSILLHQKGAAEDIAKLTPPSDVLHTADYLSGRLALDTNVLIDAGKTFREAYFNVLVKKGVNAINALLLTHEHADAMQGLDDIRDLQPLGTKDDHHYSPMYYVPTYITEFTLKSIQQKCDYIISRSRFINATPTTDAVFGVIDYKGDFDSIPQSKEQHDAALAKIPMGSHERRATSLDIVLIPEAPKRLYIPSLPFPIYSFPVWHGSNYVSMAYAFGSGLRFKVGSKWASENPDAEAPRGDGERSSSIIYISDVSGIPDESLEFLKAIEHVDILIVDLLLGADTKHFSHYCYDDVIALAELLNPRECYGVGMYCVLVHDDTNKDLAASLEGLKAAGKCSNLQKLELAYDGLSLPIQ